MRAIEDPTAYGTMRRDLSRAHKLDRRRKTVDRHLDAVEPRCGRERNRVGGRDTGRQVGAVKGDEIPGSDARREGRRTGGIHDPRRVEEHARAAEAGRRERHVDAQVGTDPGPDPHPIGAHHIAHDAGVRCKFHPGPRSTASL